MESRLSVEVFELRVTGALCPGCRPKAAKVKGGNVVAYIDLGLSQYHFQYVGRARDALCSPG